MTEQWRVMIPKLKEEYESISKLKFNRRMERFRTTFILKEQMNGKHKTFLYDKEGMAEWRLFEELLSYASSFNDVIQCMSFYPRVFVLQY